MSKLSFWTTLKKYWYIAVPIHVCTSACWGGLCYGAIEVGLDFVPVLEKSGLPQKYIDPLKRGNIGKFAQAAILYKIASPLRYASTLAATGYGLKYMRRRGLIK